MTSYFKYWGKAKPADGASAPFHLLPYHCLDVAAVGMVYLRRAPAVRNFLAESLRLPTAAEIDRWVAFWLALHDLGKFSVSFQGQREDLLARLQGVVQRKRYGPLRHDSLGMAFWKSALCKRVREEQWFGPQTDEYTDGLHWWVRAVTGHHGEPPIEGRIDLNRQSIPADRQAIFDFVSDVRSLLLDETSEAIISGWDPSDFEYVSRTLSWWMAGIAILADWIGSNTDFFPYRADFESPVPLAEYWEYALEQANKALNHTGVLPVRVQSELQLSELFGYIETPSPLQAWAANVVLSREPQIHLLEDMTGAGKTEAALLLAHRLVSSGSADGFFIGLPTMATANAMYGRVAEVYTRLFADDANLALAHGERHLVERFAMSVLSAGAAEDDAAQSDDTATARCTAWLADHNKRSLLASAGVGTIDQALLSAMTSRHQSLRLLGLFRKVLIVDEVHACDRYMQTVLENLLEFHAAAGGSAILLSATLPQRMKRSLLNAYARGRRHESPPIARDAYPLVTSWYSDQPEKLFEQHIPTREDVRRTLGTHYVSDESEVKEAIKAALREGKSVCWMRNTVADAIDAYDYFCGHIPADRLMLFHARFALAERLETERKVLQCFGKESTRAHRSGRLVIATQVAEQSLDADWDFMVSDLAPIDRLIQRAGRLHRHPRAADGSRLNTPDMLDERGEPCLWVFGPSWEENPGADWFKRRFPKAAAVYPDHAQQWLTAELLQVGQIVLPENARELIESVFGEEVVVPPGLQESANRAEGQDYSDAAVAQSNTIKIAAGYTQGFVWWSESRAPSRLGEATSQVLLARWEGDLIRPWARQSDERHAWAYSTIRMPARLIDKTAEPGTASRREELERVLLTLPNKGQWVVLLPLEEQEAGGWVGVALDASEKSRTWRYCSLKGLLEVQTEFD